MGVQLFEKKPISDHIQVAAFPAAKEKGEVCVFGSLVGFSDYDTAAGAAGSVTIGKPIAVFQAATAGITGTAAIGADVFVASDNTLTTTAGSNKLLGTVVAVGSTTIDIAITG